MPGENEFVFPDEADNTPAKSAGEVVSDAVEVEVIDDTPERDRNRKPLDAPVADPTEDELNSYTKGVRERIDKLTHARHDERRRADALERELAEMRRVTDRVMRERQEMQKYIASGQKQYVETLKESADREVEIARREYREAYESGDPDKLTAATERMTAATLKKAEASNFRAPVLQTEEPEVQPRQEVARETALDRKTLDWQARNQWFGASGNEEVTSYALGLHQKLVNSGVDPRSDEYFKAIDKGVRSKFPEVVGGDDGLESKSETQRKPASVVAPATRVSGAKTIRLTKTQVALAQKLGLTPQQYAAELAKLEN